MSSFETDVYKILSGSSDEVTTRSRCERLRPWYHAFLAPWLPSDKAAPLLDVPCGAGNLLFALKAAGYQNLTGIDGDEKQVTLAQRMDLPARQGDAFEAIESASEGSIVRIFSVDFLEHLEPEAAARFCRAAFRALTPGGFFICRTPSADGPFGSHDRYNDITHRWAMSSGAAHVLMQLAGFQGRDVSIHQEAPVPYKWQNYLRRGLFEITTRVLGTYLNLSGIDAPRIWTRSMWIVAKKPS